MLQVQLYGTRGSVAQAGEKFQKYGGNTQCVLIEAGGDALLLDAGTGIVKAAGRFQAGEPVRILLTHYHMDHLSGLAMFEPLFTAESRVEIFAPSYGGLDSRAVLDRIFAPPLWPVSLSELSADIAFYTVVPGEAFSVGDFMVKTLALCHPGGSVGYRVEQGGKSVVYLFDHEADAYDIALTSFLQEADLVICDAPYVLEEYTATYTGFGHSAVERMLAEANRAGVKKLVLSHHLPNRTDAQIDELQAQFPEAIFAREGERFIL